MEDTKKYGCLLNSDAKLFRQYFREAVKLIGINVLFRAPKPDKHWTTYGELESNFEDPIRIGCLFHEHPNQKTLKKLGWISELDDKASLVDLDYDLEGIQVGALIIIPSGIDSAPGRIFRITNMQTSMVYPSCVTCEVVPEIIDNFVPEDSFDFTTQNHTLVTHVSDPTFIDLNQSSFII